MKTAPLLLLLCLTFSGARSAAGREGEPLPVPLGKTSLLDDPACTVGYQRFGEDPQTLGWRWSGYDPASGVYFVPQKGDDGRPVLFMHCPWQAGCGVAYADFHLALPHTKRIRLNLATALRHDATQSDGSCFRVRLDGTLLWEAHVTWKTWRDAVVDLSPFAGRAVVLRLEVDPGPERSPTEDWSLWGRVEVEAGTEAELTAARAQQERAAAVRRQHDLQEGARRAGADLTAFCGGEAFSVRPSTLSPVTNSLQSSDGEHRFVCRGADETIEYRFDPNQGLLDGLSVWVDGVRLDPPAFRGGASVILGGREYGPGSMGLNRRLLAASRDGDRLTCRYEYQVAGVAETARLTAILSVEGKSLALSLRGEAGQFTGFAAGNAGGEEVVFPFSGGCVPQRHPLGVYSSAFADLWQSDASRLGRVAGAYHTTYLPLTDGRRRPLREVFFLTVSRRLEETLANVPNAVLGLAIPEVIAYMAEPGRDVSRLKNEILQALAAQAWYMH
ncbi:MAG: hypothetical protein QHJ73_14730, partial [Armatimonadota bacterium]|nr:hypothetical protein [Armatimonadota bacterium]